MNRRLRVASLFLFALGLACAAVPALADATYTYTGPDYSTGGYNGPFTGSEDLSGSLTLSSPLGDNLTNYTIPVGDIVTFSFTDGLNTLTPVNVSSPTFTFSTDSNGNIDAEKFFLAGPYYDSSDYYGNYDYVEGTYYAYTSGVGSWASPLAPAATPEPPGITLLGLGMLVLGAFFILRQRVTPLCA